MEGAFCESVMWGYPEYVNSVSSVPICLVGLLGLYLSPRQNLFAQLVFALMVVNGVGSFGYHWSGDGFWRYFDGNPMIIAASMGALFATDEIIRVRTVRFGRGRSARTGRPSLWSASNAVFWSAFAVASLWLDVQPEYQKFAGLTFGVPASAFIAAVLLARYVTHKGRLSDDWKITKYGRLGITCSLLSAAIWILTETNCREHRWLAYLHGHFIWHVGCSYGLFLVIQFTVWFSADRYGCRPYFRRAGWWSRVCPTVGYDLNPHVMTQHRDEPTVEHDVTVQALFSTVAGFLPLRPDELARLAQTAERELYPVGEVIIGEGDAGSSMFVVAAGRVEVLLSDGDGDLPGVTLSRGAIIGERSLLLGEPRSATVRGVTSVVLYEIDRSSFFPIMRDRPAIIGELGALLSYRQTGSLALAGHFEGLIRSQLED